VVILDIVLSEVRMRPPLLVTERLALRELRLDDARAVAERAGDKRVARYLIAVPSPYPVTLATRWIVGRLAWWGQGRGVTMAITKRETPDQLIGSVSLRRYVRDRRAELGYWLGAESWGSGFATEAAEALLEFGFRDLQLSKVYAQVLEGNRPSCHVLEKLGMIEEGVRRRHIRKGKRLLDVTLYGMLKEEWRPLR
jgi:ribosomal-protein-alanine N-acetyltransferase